MNKGNIKYALLSVFDKTGIVELAKELQKLNYKIISTGGTAKVLKEHNINVVPIQEITGNPEAFDGRMKTISFQIESGILFDRENKEHIKQAKELGIKPIDIVVCNLYPFEETVSSPKVLLEDAIESVDVGGPTMIRAAAKNFQNVLAVIDPKDYNKIIEVLHAEKNRNVQNKIRKTLAAKAFNHLSFYDSQIARFLGSNYIPTCQVGIQSFPEEITIPGRKCMDLRYGENPHQKASLYTIPNSKSPFSKLQRHWGRDLSWLNITDINAGLECVRLFDPKKDGVCTVIIKHNSPSGIALGKTPKEALKRAIQGDPESAFGGIIVTNSKMDLNAAKIIGEFKDKRKSNIDIVAVPEIEQKGLDYLKKIRKSMGIYTFGSCHPEFISGSSRKKMLKRACTEQSECVQHDKYNIKHILGGFILQESDDDIEKSFKDWKVVARKKPTKKEFEQMKIAWKFISRIRSNTILVMDKELPMTRGIGSGQTSRFRSTKIALEQAGNYAKRSVMASDSFFPFDDSVKLAQKHGISAIVQQGGSINDKISIEAADKAGIAMVFTGRRAFWH